MKHVAIMIPTLGKGGAEKQGIQLLNALGEKYRIQLIITYPEVGYEPELLSSITSDNYEIYKLSGSTLRRLMSIYNILREGKTDAMFCYLTWPDFYGPIIGKLAGVAKIYQGIRSVYLPKSKLEEVKSFLPGLSSPTVMTLWGDSENVVVHVVVDKDKIYDSINHLKALGGKGILILTVDQMVR